MEDELEVLRFRDRVELANEQHVVRRSDIRIWKIMKLSEKQTQNKRRGEKRRKEKRREEKRKDEDSQKETYVTGLRLQTSKTLFWRSDIRAWKIIKLKRRAGKRRESRDKTRLRKEGRKHQAIEQKRREKEKRTEQRSGKRKEDPRKEKQKQM